MHARGKSDGCVVPEKPSNKAVAEAAAAERVEGRQPAKGNDQQDAAHRTQSRARVSIGLLGVREAARRDRRARFTNLLHHLDVGLLRNIRGFFDTIDHGWMLRFLEHRIADRRVLRLIQKWLKAGVLENGKWSRTEAGTPQGAVISPQLANVYLHYVLDLWVDQWRKQNASGDVIVVRYADDFALGFQHRHEAERFLRELGERMAKFELSLHPEKTRLIEFGRFAAENRLKRGQGKPESFDFLGFTHICAKKRQTRRFHVKRRTASKRLRAKLRAVRDTLMRRRHEPVAELGHWLARVVQGYLNYHAIPGNMRSLATFRRECARHLLHALRRRSQRHRMTWERFNCIVDPWLPRPKILHPHPNVRFYANHPR
jgi:group II intron reverse transcriptase/maturase